MCRTTDRKLFIGTKRLSMAFLLIFALGRGMNGIPAPSLVSVALLDQQRHPQLEAYLNRSLSTELRKIGAAEIRFAEVHDYERFMQSKDYAQHQFFIGGPVTYVRSGEYHDYHALLKTHYTDPDAYQCVIIAHKNNGITRIDDLVGRRVLMLSHYSASGNIWPRCYLYQNGISPSVFGAEPFDPVLVKTHRDVMRMVEEGIWDAATTYKRALKRYPSDQVTVIAQLPEPLTGDTVFVDDHFLNDHPAFVRAFVSAYKTGWNRDLPASGARIPDLRVFTVEDASEADFEIVRDKLSAVENMASLEHRIYGQWPGLRNNRRVVRILFWLARNQQTLQTLGITVLVLIPVGFVILVLRRRMRRMQAVGVKDRELLLQEADARLASKMNEMTELEAVLELSLKETDVYKDEGTKSELKVVQLRNEMEALRRDRDDVAADLQNEQAKLERMSSKRGADKDLSQLRRRLQRLYPPVECSEQVLKRILDLNPDQLSSFEHELQVLCFQPDKAQTRCKVQGTEASEVGFGHDGRFYYTKIGNTVKLLNVGNKSTQKKDIKGLRS